MYQEHPHPSPTAGASPRRRHHPGTWRRALAVAAATSLAATLALTTPAAADEVVAAVPGVVVDVAFDDGVATDVASGFDATLHGDPQFSTDPHRGAVVDVDGLDDAISIASEDVWDSGALADGFSVECVFRINQGMTWTNERNLCASKEAGGFSMYARSGELSIMAHVNGGWIRASHPISGHHWYHGAGTWDGSVLSLYINGELVQSTPAVGQLAAPTATAGHFVVGADAGRNGIVQLYSPPTTFASARLHSRVLTPAEIAESATPWVIDDCDIADETGPDVVLDEKFCGDTLPEGWTPVDGEWAVGDSALTGSGDRRSASRITFGEPLTNFRLDARVRIDATTDAGSWLAFALDIPSDGDQPWQHAGMRAGTTEPNSTEFARRNADSSYTVTNQYKRSPATPIGTWFDATLVVEDNIGEWRYDGELIGVTSELQRTDAGVQGLILDGMDVSFDRVTVTELPDVDVPPQCLPEGDEIREPGQAGYAVGHRGAMGVQPENTIPAFQYAIDNGAPWVEFDILWTSDEEIVVLHDDTVDRTMTGTGAVKEMTLEEFKALDIQGHPGLKAPTFAEALAWMKETGAKASIEYKGDFPLHLAQKTADLIREYDVADQSAALSFSLVSIMNMRTVMPELDRHINLSSIPEDPVAFAQQYGAKSLTWRNPTPPAEVVAALHAAGVKLNSGTTDSLGSWEAAAALGVDAITVNDPAAYAAWLATYNERHGFVDCTEPTPTPTPTPTPDPDPTPTPTPDPTPTTEPTPTPTDEPTASPSPSRPGAEGVDVYTTPGIHRTGGRWWLTTCEPYSQTIRCRTEIWSTQVTLDDGRFVSQTGWNFNNLTYLPKMTRQQWSTNPLGHAGEWTASDGRQWRTECDTAATGRGGCRSYVMTHHVAATQAPDGTWTYRVVEDWVFNNIVRFRS